MKFIAARDFANNNEDLRIEVKDAIHPRHVHKGARFDIGRGERVSDLKGSEKEFIVQLVSAGCIVQVDNDNPASLARVREIEAEVIADKKREIIASKMDVQAQLAAIGKHVADAVS